MKFNWNMPADLQPFFIAELGLYRHFSTQGDWQQAWRHLERAHILGQSYPKEHSFVHWQMLKFGFKIKSFREITGQFPRLLFGGIKSFIGKVPIGNSGGADVSMLRSMEIPADLQEILNKFSR